MLVTCLFPVSSSLNFILPTLRSFSHQLSSSNKGILLTKSCMIHVFALFSLDSYCFNFSSCFFLRVSVAFLFSLLTHPHLVLPPLINVPILAMHSLIILSCSHICNLASLLKNPSPTVVFCQVICDTVVMCFCSLHLSNASACLFALVNLFHV